MHLVSLVVLMIYFNLVQPFYFLKWNHYFSACKKNHYSLSWYNNFPILRLSSALVKICQITHLVFGSTSQFSFTFCIIFQYHFWRFLSARVKICQIHHVNFELTSQFHFKFFIIIPCNYTELLCKFLTHAFSTLGKRIPSKSQFWHFQVFWWKFAKFLISFSKQQVSFSSIFDSSVPWKITLLYFFRSSVIFFAEKISIKVQLFETLECSN